jgi:tetratricopeptide (TPR) repeat protein
MNFKEKMCMYNFVHSSNCLAGVLICFGLIAPILYLLPPRTAQAQDKCAIELAKADKEYLAGNLESAVNLINTCLSKADLTKGEHTRAYELLGLAYLGQNKREEAKAAIQKLLEVAPNYNPDPNELRPDYIKLVQEVKGPPPAPTPSQPKDKPKSSKKKLLIGGGAAAAGVVAYILLRNGDKSKIDAGFTDPPIRPPR